jgi:RNA polymerase III subunit RPC82 helix-turn-helix domain
MQQVAQVLLTKGRLTLSGIVQFTALPVRTVREALVVMIQHNICFYAEAREGLRQVCYYSIGQDEIILRLRIGRIIYWAGEWFGKEVCRKSLPYMMIFHDADLRFLGVNHCTPHAIEWTSDTQRFETVGDGQ